MRQTRFTSCACVAGVTCGILRAAALWYNRDFG